MRAGPSRGRSSVSPSRARMRGRAFDLGAATGNTPRTGAARAGAPPPTRGPTMRLMLHLFRAYPMPSFLMVLALFLSGLAEGLGVSALLPVLRIAMGSGQGAGAEVAAPPGELEAAVLGVLGW